MSSDPSYNQPYSQLSQSMDFQSETSSQSLPYQYPPQNQGQTILNAYPQVNVEMQQYQQQNQQMQNMQQMQYQQQMQQMQYQGQPVQYPGQPMQYQGQSIPNQVMVNAQGQQFVTIQIKTGIQKLQEAQGIFIKQKMDAIEVLTGCESRNVYRVYPADQNGQQFSNQSLFKCKEKSEFCTRQFCHSAMRPFNMNINNDDQALGYVQHNQSEFLSLQRPFRWTCFAYNRPEMEVVMIDNGQRLLQGKIVQPFYCCTYGVNILDEFNNLKYVISGSCCQLGSICKGLPFKDCQEFTFDVKNADGQIVTKLMKLSAGCLKSMVSDADNFSIVFPYGATIQDKTLLMSAALFIDFMYFENKHGNQGLFNNSNGGGFRASFSSNIRF